MRKPTITFDAHDRRAIAGGAAAGFALMTALALRVDWLLGSGVIAFRHTGQNVAAFVLGLDLLPWALPFTATVAAATVVTLGYTLGA